MELNTNELPKNSEQWASIDYYKNYQVSWWGRVRNGKTGRILKPGLDGQGYHHVSLNRKGQSKTHKIHILVAREWVPNPDGKRCVDHIDGNKLNNHYENLRYATHSENSRTMKRHTDGSSIYKGVSVHTQSKKWHARIMISGKPVSLGLFESEREAGESYNTAAVEHFGVFAKLNIFED